MNLVVLFGFEYHVLWHAAKIKNIFFLTELLPSMMSNGTSRKHIINISSLQGCLALPERSAYSASKHALQAFSDSLRAEVRSSRQNLHVMVVNPGYVNTNLSLNARKGDGSFHGGKLIGS